MKKLSPAMIPCDTNEIAAMKDSPAKTEVTRLLLAWGDGDTSALDQLVPLVYQELRRQARYYMARERQGHTLQATALVNEAYVRLIDVNQMQWQSRAHFLGVAAQMMRRILVESARSRSRKKRGGDPKRLSLDQVSNTVQAKTPDLAALDEALTAMAAF